MIKRSLGIFLSAALIGGVFYALPALAQPEIPSAVQIEDPFSDANGIGDDTVTPRDASTVADIGKVWFSNDAEKISAHIQTELPRSADTASGNVYEVFTNPNEEGTKCLRILAALPGGSTYQGGTLQGPPVVKLLDRCDVGDSNAFGSGVEGEFEIVEFADGTGLVTMSFPRSHSPLLAPGGVLTAPHAVSSLAVGETSTVQGFVSRMIDDTVDGTDYALQDGGDGQPSPSPSPTAGEEQPEEPKEKKCPKKGKKGKKGKKKKKCPKKPPEEAPPAACPEYVPGEQGAEAETSIVTDTATEEAPVEVTIPTDAGLGDLTGLVDPADQSSHAFHNIQVDSAAAEAGLYARWEFDTGEDYDIYLNNPDGSEAAHAAGFNPAPVSVFDGTGTGGHSEMDAEALDGIKSTDCQGYTLDIVGFLTPGGDYTLKLWLGESTYPAEAAGAVSAAIGRLV